MNSKMKRNLLIFCLSLVLAFVPFISTAQIIEADVASFVLTNEGNDKMIDRLETAGCTNLYQALKYLRADLAEDPNAPSHLTSQMDALIASLDTHPGSEVFTASLHDFTGDNNPVGINADGTFAIANFSTYDYDGHTGYTRYTIDAASTAIGSELYTYSNNSSYDIYMGSNETDLGGGVTQISNYKAFAIAWSVSPTLDVSPSALNVAAAADSTASFSVTSNTDWTVSSDQSWLTVNPVSGTGNGSVTVTAEENTGATARTATVTISATGVTSQTVTVTQATAIHSGGDGGGSCFIATAAFGTPAEKHVSILRAFRDRCLLTSEAGKAFVKFYYDVSPPLAAVIAEHESLRFVTRCGLMPFVGAAYLMVHYGAMSLLLGMLLLLTMGALVWMIRRKVKRIVQ